MSVYRSRMSSGYGVPAIDGHIVAGKYSYFWSGRPPLSSGGSQLIRLLFQARLVGRPGVLMPYSTSTLARLTPRIPHPRLFRDRATVQRQLLLPLALPHLGMLPTVLRKIVLRLQPGTGQFLVTRPARARWRDSIGGNVTAHHRVSCPVHAGRAPRWRSRRPPRAVRNRKSPSPSGTGHRSLNPNVTPPGLRPGAREGEPQARRCRSRVSVPSSAVERWPGRSARPVGRRHAQASRAGQRPGRTEPPPGKTGQPGRGGVAVGGKCAESTPARATLEVSSTTTGCTEPEVAVAVGHRTPVTEPQRHSPRSATGGAGGRAAGEAMPLPRQRSVVGR